MSTAPAWLQACSCRSGVHHLASLVRVWVGIPVVVFTTILLGLRRRRELTQTPMANQATASDGPTPAESTSATTAPETQNQHPRGASADDAGAERTAGTRTIGPTHPDEHYDDL